jgi:hypothetical protein
LGIYETWSSFSAIKGKAAKCRLDKNMDIKEGALIPVSQPYGHVMIAFILKAFRFIRLFQDRRSRFRFSSKLLGKKRAMK